MSEYCTCATSFDGSCEIHDQITALKARLAEARRVCDEQANDEGLWFVAETVTEDYLQAALRRLHAAVEGTASQPPTACTCDGEYQLDADCHAHGDPSFANVDRETQGHE